MTRSQALVRRSTAVAKHAICFEPSHARHVTPITPASRRLKDNPRSPSQFEPDHPTQRECHLLAEHLWEIDVFVEENERQLVNSITVQADGEAEALRLAMAEMSRALAILSSRSKVVGARANRKQDV